MDKINLGNIQISEICLGCSKIETPTLRDYFDLGGNFIDTSPLYLWGRSEQCIGNFGHRSELVIGTKVGLSNTHKGLSCIDASVNQSLQNLKTDYVDILWIHAWDYNVHPDDVKRTLLGLKTAGKTLALGVSNTPAWIISMMGCFDHIQLEYNFRNRSADMELLPVAKFFNMGVMAYSPFCGGDIFRKELPVSQLGDIYTMTIRWLRWKNIIPVIRMEKHLKENVDSLDAEITTSIEKLDALTMFSTQNYSPHDFLASGTIRKYGCPITFLILIIPSLATSYGFLVQLSWL